MLGVYTMLDSLALGVIFILLELVLLWCAMANVWLLRLLERKLESVYLSADNKENFYSMLYLGFISGEFYSSLPAILNVDVMLTAFCSGL